MRVVSRYPCRPNQGYVAAAKLFGIEEVPTTQTSHLSEADTSGILGHLRARSFGACRKQIEANAKSDRLIGKKAGACPGLRCSRQSVDPRCNGIAKPSIPNGSYHAMAAS